MKNRSFWVNIRGILFCLPALVLIAGCPGSDSREKVDDVVEEMTGKKDVERMQRMKQDLEQIKKDQQDHYDQLDRKEE